MDIDSYVKVRYESYDEANYEINTSNTKHIEAIQDHIADALNYGAGVVQPSQHVANLCNVSIVNAPQVTDMITILTETKNDLTYESERYTNFSAAFQTFVSLVYAEDESLATTIKQIYDENYDASKYDSLVDRYKNDRQNNTMDYASFLGLSAEDIATMQAILDRIKQLEAEGKTPQEILDVLNQEIGGDPRAKSYLDQLSENLVSVDGTVTVADIVASLVDGYAESKGLSIAGVSGLSKALSIAGWGIIAIETSFDIVDGAYWEDAIQDAVVASTTAAVTWGVGKAVTAATGSALIGAVAGGVVGAITFVVTPLLDTFVEEATDWFEELFW